MLKKINWFWMGALIGLFAIALTACRANLGNLFDLY